MLGFDDNFLVRVLPGGICHTLQLGHLPHLYAEQTPAMACLLPRALSVREPRGWGHEVSCLLSFIGLLDQEQ